MGLGILRLVLLIGWTVTMFSVPAFMYSTAGATTPVRPPGELAFDQAPPTPPGQTIDWLTKQAADALARCDEASFNFWKAGLEAVVGWVERKTMRAYYDVDARLERATSSEKPLLLQVYSISYDLYVKWGFYRYAIRTWTYVAPVPCPPATAPGQALLVPLPEQPALQPRSFQSNGDFKFVQGTQLGTLNVNLAVDSGISCTYSGGVSTRLPLIPLAPGGVSLAPGGAPPANPGGTSIPPNSPVAGGTPDSPTTTAPPGTGSPAGTQTATTPQSPGGNNTDTSPPPSGSAQAPPNSALADIFFPPKSSPRSSPGRVVLLPPGFSPPPPGPATSDDPSAWSTAPPGGHPPDAVQPDGTYVSPETIEWFKNELDKLPRQSSQAGSTPNDQKAPGSTSPAPSSSPQSSAPPSATARPQGGEPSLLASQLMADILSGKDVTIPIGPPSMTVKNPEVTESDKPGSSAQPPAGAPTWIGPVPSGTFTPKITSRPETLPDSVPTAPSGTPHPSTDTPPASTAPSGAPSAPSPVASVPDTDAQQEIRVTVYFKPKLAALPQGEIPKTAEGHIAGLFAEVPALPGPPGSIPTQAMRNTGAGGGVWRCKDDGSWSCTMGESLAGLSRAPGTSPGLSDKKTELQPGSASGLRLPNVGFGRNSHYQIDVPVSQTAGGVIETTGGKTEPNLTAPAGLNVIGQTFAVGPRTFTRLSFAQPFGLGIDPNAHFQERFGEKYKVDFCFEEAPMGAHAIASSVLNSELPAASIKLRLSSRPRSSTR